MTSSRPSDINGDASSRPRQRDSCLWQVVRSSYFPHEVNDDYCKREITEIVENEHLTDEDKHAVLHRNTERFYNLSQLIGSAQIRSVLV